MIKENMFNDTKAFWEEEIVRGNLRWPTDSVIRFVKRYYQEPSKTRILDFGCGGGRNTIALAMDGYHMVAMDYTSSAMDLVKEKNTDNYAIELVQNQGIDISLMPESVDGIIADGSMFYNDENDTIELMKNLLKTLKSGGRFWADWRSVEDSLYHMGQKLGQGLVLLNKESKRENCYYFFCDKATLKQMYEEAGFVVEQMEDYRYTMNNGTRLCAYYHVVAIKP